MLGSRKLRFISLFVYGGVVVLLVYLAVFGRGFSQSVGQVRLSGRYAAFPLFGTRVKDVTVSFHGLSLQFSPSRLLTLTDSSGGTSTYQAVSVRTFTDEAEITFQDGPRISITADGSSSAYSISLDVSPLKPAFISIPCTFRGSGAQDEGSPSLSWKDGSQNLILTLPEGSRAEPTAGVLTVAGGSSLVQIRARSVEPALSGSYASWLSAEDTLVSPESLRKTLTAFMDSAYAGWARDRVTTAGTWKGADGSASFSEAIGQALISASIPRGSYLADRAVYQQILFLRLSQNPQGEFDLSSSPFIGNLREFQRRVELGENAEVDRIRGLISVGSTELLTLDYPVIPFLLDHGPFSLVENTMDLLRNMNPPRADTAAALGMIETFLDYAAYVNEGSADISLCRAAVEKGILPFIRSSAGGIFLTDGRGSTVDVRQSLRAASILGRASEHLALPILGSLARSIEASSLAMAASSGFLPAVLHLSPNGRPVQEGSLAPETVHRYLSPSSFIPAETPLYTTLGPGTWIWTAAKVDSIQAPAGAFRITLSFPIGLPHYVMIQGMPPFATVLIHGIAWRSDPQYAQYSDGWFYDQEKKTFYLKLTGKEEKEEIAFTF